MNYHFCKFNSQLFISMILRGEWQKLANCPIMVNCLVPNPIGNIDNTKNVDIDEEAIRGTVDKKINIKRQK